MEIVSLPIKGKCMQKPEITKKTMTAGVPKTTVFHARVRSRMNPVAVSAPAKSGKMA